MRWVTKLRLRLRSLLQRGAVEQELDEELRFHLERLTEENLAAGMSPADARNAAMREMGGLDQRKEECRDARGVALVDEVRQDVGYALRGLRRSPGFTAVAVVSLALGIGANTTIFTFVNAVLLTPLPYPGSNRLLTLREQRLGSAKTVGVHPQNFLEWRARARSFEALALLQTPPLDVIGPDGPEQIGRAQTTHELFDVFGVAPVLGRAFTPEESRPGRHDVVILGHGFWQRSFGGDPGVLGRRLRVRDGSLEIVGVAPAGLRIGLKEPAAYTPLAIDPARPDSIGSRSFQCYGRLKPGVRLETARAEMSAIASALERQYPMDKGYGVFVSGLHDDLVREGRPALRLLMAVVATVLVIACVNLAGLLMARGVRRRGELAVRAALGAGRRRLLQQMIVESLVLAALGGVAGFALAYWATRALVRLTAGALAMGTTAPIRLDATCLVFTVGMATVTALVFGLAPAWQGSRISPQAALAERTRGGSADRRQQRMRSGLVVAEVALAVVLLVGASLLLRTFSRLVRVDLGFQPAETMTMGLFLGMRPPEARIALVDQILDRVEAVPGVEAASTIQFLPLSGMNCGTGFRLDQPLPGHAADALSTECSLVSRGYFAAMGIPILEGRAFDRRDRMGSPRVVIVNKSFARQYLPEGRALGRRIVVDWEDRVPSEIVGVAGDVRHNGLTSDPAPTVFLLHAQAPGYITNLVVRAKSDPAATARAVRSAIRDVDPMQAVSTPKTMDQYLQDALARPRLYAALVTSFALLAVLLAGIGIYGLIAYVVAQRTHEIGIRLALGASRGDVFRAIFRRGAGLTVAGLGLGLLAALGLRGLVSRLLFGVTAADAVSYGLAAVALGAVAVAATAIPALRASRVDPTTALRCE